MLSTYRFLSFLFGILGIWDRGLGAAMPFCLRLHHMFNRYRRTFGMCGEELDEFGVFKEI